MPTLRDAEARGDVKGTWPSGVYTHSLLSHIYVYTYTRIYVYTFYTKMC